MLEESRFNLAKSTLPSIWVVVDGRSEQEIMQLEGPSEQEAERHLHDMGAYVEYQRGGSRCTSESCHLLRELSRIGECAYFAGQTCSDMEQFGNFDRGRQHRWLCH